MEGRPTPRRAVAVVDEYEQLRQAREEKERYIGILEQKVRARSRSSERRTERSLSRVRSELVQTENLIGEIVEMKVEYEQTEDAISQTANERLEVIKEQERIRKEQMNGRGFGRQPRHRIGDGVPMQPRV